MKELMIEMRFPLGFLLPQKRDTGPCPNKWNVSVALKSARSIPGEEHVCRRYGYAVLCSACALPILWGGCSASSGGFVFHTGDFRLDSNMEAN